MSYSNITIVYFIFSDATAAPNPCNGAGSYKITGAKLIPRQFLAIFTKRFNYLRRSKKAFVSQVISLLLPVF
jgi:hypothetical protein